MKRIAFIDLGSNSVRYIVMEIAEDLNYKLIYQQKETIRLSEGLSTHNRLTDEAIKRAIAALQSFAVTGQKMKVDDTIAIATAAVRQASNGQDFIDLVAQKTNFHIQCISGEEEARLGYIGVVNTLALSDFVLFDLGGASVEVSLIRDRKIVHSRSFPIGALTLKERFQKGDEITKTEYKKMIAYLQDLFGEEPWLNDVKLPLVGIGGTVRNIGKINQRKHNYPIPKLHHYELALHHFQPLLGEILQKKLSQRKKISGLSSERADIIIPGMTIVNELLEMTQGTSLIVSGNGLREGLFYDYYGREYNHNQPILDNSLRQSVENYFLNLHCEEKEHVLEVVSITDTLFSKLQTLHGCSERYRDILYAASMLHDAGKVVNYYSHPKHSTYMILNGPLYGITHQEQTIAAFIGGFSHGIDNKLARLFVCAQSLLDDDWKIIRRLSLLLAVAENLSGAYEGIISAVTPTITDKKVILELKLSEAPPPIVPLSDMPKIQKQFKKEYGRSLQIKTVL